jgi:SAM-dependent methyltransferase
MVEKSDEARAALLRRAWLLLNHNNGLLGFDDARAQQYIGNLTNLNAQDFLYDAIEYSIGIRGFFQSPRSILEAGCGTAAFLFSALQRGHDGFGIDNDKNRLAVAYAKLAAYALPAAWRERAMYGDAAATPFDANTFDVVLGHQFIEHVTDIPGTLSEFLRITKRGGFIVLYAPDYRAPYEAHYEIPWPPFASRTMAEAWLEAFDRPDGFLDFFNYVTLPQVGAIFQTLDCDIVTATIDRAIDPLAVRTFDLSSQAALAVSARKVQSALAAGTLADQYTKATSFAVVVRKR